MSCGSPGGALFLAALVLVAAPGSAQKLDPIKWSLAVEPTAAAPGGKVIATLEARMEPGWAPLFALHSCGRANRHYHPRRRGSRR